MGIFVRVLSRILAVGTTLLLLIAAGLYSSAGESLEAYLLVVTAWVFIYVLSDWWLCRPGRSRARLRHFALICLAATGTSLSLLSAGMGLRYSMTSEVLHELNRRARRDSAQTAGSAAVSFYSTNQPKLPRLIFVHGTPGHAGVFADYILNPMVGFESIAVDRPGFGQSQGSGPVVSFEAQAKALSALLVQRDGQWPILVGHSLGGPIVARIAADYPDKVRGVVILAGSLDPNLEAPQWYNEVTDVPIVDMKMPGMYENSNREIDAAPQQTRDLAKVLDRIRCPVEVVHGTADTLVPVANADYIKRSLTNSPRVGITLIEGEGHGIHKLRSSEVRAAVSRVIVPLAPPG